MGLFKKIGRAFKKVVKGIGKGIKKTLSAINKVQKKIRKSKLFKALVIAAAVVVTGGAALSAMGATTGAGLFGSAAAAGGTGFAGWMTGTAASLTSTAVGSALATPFTMLGTAAGKAALALGVPAISNSSITGAVAAPTLTGAAPTIIEGGGITAANAGTGIPGAASSSNVVTATRSAGAIPSVTNTVVTAPSSPIIGGGYTPTVTGTVPTIVDTGGVVAANAGSGIPGTTASFASKYPRTTKFLGTVGTGVATSVATGYAMQQIAGDPELQGSMSGLRTEGATQFDPLLAYAGYKGIDESDVSKFFTFGNTTSAGNIPLFKQETLAI